MKKKMIIAVVFVAALAITASATFAYDFQKPQMPRFNGCCFNQDPCCPEVTVDTYNKAMIKNSVVASTNTGFNVIKDYKMVMPTFGYGYFPMPSGSADIDTGDATAINDVSTGASTTVSVNAPSQGELNVKTTSMPYVENKVEASAITGFNSISKVGSIESGAAGSQNTVLTVTDVDVDVD